MSLRTGFTGSDSQVPVSEPITMARGREYADWAGLSHVPTLRARNVDPSGPEIMVSKKKQEKEWGWISFSWGNQDPKGLSELP